jgi:KUP system potassium uptake protein
MIGKGVRLRSIKYIGFVLYADDHGEGGVFALLGLLNGMKYFGAGLVSGMLLLGAGLLYGDGLITPAISILSAVEGLEYMTAAVPALRHLDCRGYCPGTLRSATQRDGQGGILVWLVHGAVARQYWPVWSGPGLAASANSPGHQPRVRPHLSHPPGLGPQSGGPRFVMLAITGGEAMYADMGHFGRLPIQVGWLGLTYPCLLLNYAGQGAFLLGHLEGGGTLPNQLHVFYATFNAVVPGTGPLVLMVSLATMATIIASQALISGAYSLTAQAIALGYGGRMDITHTSTEHAGQIYMRSLTWLLCAGCLMLIFTFQSSSHLAAAYGLAVSGVMLSTSLAMIPLAVLRWRWSVWRACLLFGGFAGLEGMFVLANTLKFLEGGFVPLAIGLGLFVAMYNYHWGRQALLAQAYAGFAASEICAGSSP